jgi:hypothetical protein
VRGGGITGTPIEPRFPVTLSEQPRRAILVESGLEPEPVQYYEVGDLVELEDDELRARVVEIWDRTKIAVDESAPHVRRYGPLEYSGREWWLRTNDHMYRAHDLVRATPGRTQTVLSLAAQDASSPFWPSLWTAPMVRRLREDATLDLSGVLEAYEEVIAVAERAADLVSEARHQSGGLVIVSDDREHITIVPPDPEGEQIRIDLLRESDPDAFDEGITLVEQVADLPEAAVRALAVQATAAVFDLYYPDGPDPTDAEIVASAVVPAARRVLDQAREDEKRAAADASYVSERKRWIAARGSERLKLAAARGYKHDAIYRDERLVQELPEFVGALPRESQVREAINPSAEALEAESRVLDRVENGRFGDVDVRIVWVQIPDYQPPGPGEYVQVKGYLGRHSVYRRISPEEKMPF